MLGFSPVSSVSVSALPFAGAVVVPFDQFGRECPDRRKSTQSDYDRLGQPQAQDSLRKPATEEPGRRSGVSVSYAMRFSAVSQQTLRGSVTSADSRRGRIAIGDLLRARPAVADGRRLGTEQSDATRGAAHEQDSRREPLPEETEKRTTGDECC